MNSIPVYKMDDTRKRVYYTYVLKLENGENYVGSTSNLDRRWKQHIQNVDGSKKTRRNKPIAIIHYETHLTRLDAVKRENALKNQFLKPSAKLHKTKGCTMVKRKKRTTKKRAATKKRRASRRRNPYAKRRMSRKIRAKRPARRTRQYRKRRSLARRRNAPISFKRRRNPGRKFRRRSYRLRRNPGMKKMFSFLNQKFLMRSAGIAGGVAAGYIAMPLYTRMLPESVTSTNRRFYGLLNVLLGGLIFVGSRKGVGKDFGITLSGTGVYDLVAKLLPDLGLPALPNSSAMIDQLLPEEKPAALEANYYPRRSLSANYRPRTRMSANYQPGLSANYQAPALFGGAGNSSPDMGL